MINGLQKKVRIVNRDLLNESHKSRCVVCRSFGCDPDHVKTKKSGGDDIKRNIMSLCRRHHSEKGTLGISAMANKYHRYKQWLIDNDWYFCDLKKKWIMK